MLFDIQCNFHGDFALYNIILLINDGFKKKRIERINTFKYHVFAPIGRFSGRINLPLFSSVLPSNSRLFLSGNNLLLDGWTLENKGKLILYEYNYKCYVFFLFFLIPFFGLLTIPAS